MKKKANLWVKSIIILPVAIITVILRLHSLGEPLERDLTSYAYIAHQILAGEKLYTSIWDHKPPGVYWTYMLAELLWGYDSSAVVYLGILFTLISLLFLFLFLRRIAGVNAALVGSTFWALASNSILLEANQPNVEVFLNAFTLIAIWSFTKYYDGKRSFLFLSGLFFAAASLFKMIAVFPLGALCIYLMLPLSKTDIRGWFNQGLKKTTIFLLPSALIWMGVFLYFGLQGRLGDFREAVFTFNRYYSGNFWLNIWNFFINPQLFFHPSLKDIWILVMLSFAWLFLSQRAYGTLRRSFFVFLLFGLWIEISSPGRYYPHYYQLLIPIFSILPALFLSDLAEYLKTKKMILRMGAVITLYLFSLGYLSYYQWTYLKMSTVEISEKKYGPRFVQAHDLAKYIKKITSHCDTIYEWGAETGIYYYSQRQAVSGIFYMYPLFWAPPKERLRYVRKVFGEVTSSPPAIFIWNNSYGRVGKSMFSVFIQEKYNLIKRSNGYTIYEYKYRKEKGDEDC